MSQRVLKMGEGVIVFEQSQERAAKRQKKNSFPPLGRNLWPRFWDNDSAVSVIPGFDSYIPRDLFHKPYESKDIPYYCTKPPGFQALERFNT